MQESKEILADTLMGEDNIFLCDVFLRDAFLYMYCRIAENCQIVYAINNYIAKLERKTV